MAGVRQPTGDQKNRQTQEEEGRLARQVRHLAETLDRSGIIELVEFYRHPRRMMWVSFASGIIRGAGMAIGFTAVGAVVLYLLSRLAALNLPLIGEFIADITRIVERELQFHPGP